MTINKLVIKNYKLIRDIVIPLNSNINIFVGENDAGKSTILEALSILTTGKLNGYAFERQLKANLFNSITRQEYITAISAGKTPPPPRIVFEAYFDSMNDNVTKAIVKYEMPLAMLTTLGVTVSDYAIRANSSFYEINIRSGRKHGENATYVKFWHRSTRTKGETTPKFGVWISPGNERFLFVAYIERDDITWIVNHI